MLFTVDGQQITEVAYKQKFIQRMKDLTNQEYSAIVEELNKVIDRSDVHTSSWIPGHNWTGTVYQPIWRVCGENNETAAKFFGQILYKVFIDRPDTWCFGAYPHAKGKTYFRIQR